MSQLTTRPSGHQDITFHGRTYALDRRPDSHLLRGILPRFREAYASIPEGKWEENDQIATFNPPLLNQIQNGCVGHGGSTGFTLAWLIAGLTVPAGGFSPTWAYALTNGGHDDGASIGDLIHALQNSGMATNAVFPESKYMLGGAAETAARSVALKYLLDDAYQITSHAEKGTALSMGYSIADSVMVGNDFENLDANGFVPVDRGSGNHCTAAGGLRRFKGKVGFKHQNSWGPNFGLSGMFFTNQDHILSQGEGYSGVVFRTVKPPPGFVAPTIA